MRKIKIRRLRHGFAVLAMLTVFIACSVVSQKLCDLASSVVAEREKSALQDEGNGRCWEIIDAVNQTRRQLFFWTRNNGKDDFEKECEKLKQRAALSNRREITWRDYVISICQFKTDGTLERTFYASPSISGYPNPTTAVLKRASEAQTAFTQLDGIIPVKAFQGILPSQPLPSAAPTSTTPERIPAIWIVIRFEAPRDLNSDTTREYHLLAMLISLQRGQSPRHLQFLFNRDGENLMGTSVGGQEPMYKDIDFKTKIRQLKWNVTAAQEPAQTQRPNDAPLRATLLQPYYFLQGTIPNLPASLFGPKGSNTTVWMDDLSLKIEQKGVLFSAGTPGTKTISLLARDITSLNDARDSIEKAYGGLQTKVNWNTPVAVEHSILQFLRFYLQIGSEIRQSDDVPYYFAYAAFEEELAAAISDELKTMRLWSLGMALAAGAMAYLASLWLLMPLTRIAKTARNVTKPGAEIGKEHIEKVRSALPIRRSDEIGDIARALEDLLRRAGDAHARLQQWNKDLEKAVKEKTALLNDANEELRAGEKAKDAFIANVSHELRQPMNSIFGYLEFVEESNLTESQRRDVGRVRLAAKYLKKLIDDVLDYQKIILGGVVLDPEEFETAEFLQELCAAMAPQAKERGNRLECNVRETVGLLCHDRVRLRQVIVNLLSNACKFTDHGVVTLTANGELDEAGQKWVRFEIADTGRGIKPEELETLFVRFKKLSARQGNQSGTGLGLVISKELVGLMGGTISCSSEFGKGSVFTVRIPATLRGAKLVQPVAVQPITPIIAHQRPTVLVIDDDPTICELMERFLGSKGYDVISAGDGRQGVAMARDRQPAVITLDVILPGGQTGWDVLGELKADSRTAEIPVIIITFLEDSRRGFALGAADYIVKPIEWDSLLHSIKRIAGISPASPVLVVEDDPDMREIFRRQLSDGGLEVVEAGDGVEALKRLQEITPSLILLDLIMPNMDGFGFVAEFNRHPEWRAIPILIITSKNPTREDRERLTGTVRAILEKDGTTQEELVATVASLIGQRTPVGRS